MERAERTGLSLALLGHIALVAVLSLKLISDKSMPDIVAEPMTVDLVTDGGEPMSLPAPAPVPDQAPDGEPAPTTDAVPLPQGPSPEQVAERARADAAEAAAQAKASQEAADAKAAADRAAAAALAARKSKDAATAKLALQKAEADAKAARDKAAASKAAADKAARDKAARDAAAKLAAQKAAAAKAANAKAAADKAAKDAAAKAAAEKARLAKLKNDAAKGKGGTGLGDLQIGGDATPKGDGISTQQTQQIIDTAMRDVLSPRFRRCAPTGIDLDKIITFVQIDLKPDGSVANVAVTDQTGINDSNRPQANLLKACAIKAVRTSPPFTNFPVEHYALWKSLKKKLKTK
jgi:colicin import membrane protein